MSSLTISEIADALRDALAEHTGPETILTLLAACDRAARTLQGTPGEVSDTLPEALLAMAIQTEVAGVTEHDADDHESFILALCSLMMTVVIDTLASHPEHVTGVADQLFEAMTAKAYEAGLFVDFEDVETGIASVLNTQPEFSTLSTAARSIARLIIFVPVAAHLMGVPVCIGSDFLNGRLDGRPLPLSEDRGAADRLLSRAGGLSGLRDPNAEQPLFDGFGAPVSNLVGAQKDNVDNAIARAEYDRWLLHSHDVVSDAAVRAVHAAIVWDGEVGSKAPIPHHAVGVANAASCLSLRAQVLGRLLLQTTAYMLAKTQSRAEFAFSTTAMTRFAAAVPYWLPPGAAAALVGSDPPDEQLLDGVRLPYRNVWVCFADELDVSVLLDERRRIPGEEKWYSGPDFDDALDDLLATVSLSTPADRVDSGEVRLTGVVLSSRADGRLHNEVVWLLRDSRTDAEEGASDRDAVAGFLSDAAEPLRRLVANVAGLLQWGPWLDAHEPAVPRHIGPDLHDAMRKGPFRKKARHAENLGVHVLDFGRAVARGRASDATTDDAAQARRAPHWRRGHWHRYRVGPRDNWVYEGRWIPPVQVNGEPTQARVYRMPAR